MKLLGAIVAGGRSTRFGSDKALAVLDGRPLIEHVIAGMAPQVDEILVCGREWSGLPSVPDRPRPDLGPLGGIAAALAYAGQHGFDMVLTAGCDVLPVPPDLAARLLPAPALFATQPLFGLWPVSLLPLIDRQIEQDDRSLRGWASAAHARTVACELSFYNFNNAEELIYYKTRNLES